MNIDTLQKIVFFIVVALAQVLVLNHIHLLGVATPLMYVYFVILFRRNYSRVSILLWSFLLGSVIDIFSNTTGAAAGAMTLLGILQPYLLMPFIQRDSDNDMEPSISTLGFAPFCYFTFISTLIYSIVFFSLEMFSFFNMLLWGECILGSTIITFVLIIVIDNLRSR
jgi:rod shape-determining protein MreD